jgi:hypothetical protein
MIFQCIGTWTLTPLIIKRGKISLGLKVMLSLLLAKKVTMTASVLNQELLYHVLELGG